MQRGGIVPSLVGCVQRTSRKALPAGALRFALRTLIWLDPSSPRRQFFLVGLGAGTVLIVPAPRPPSRLGDVRALFRLSRLISWLVPEGIPLEKAEGTGRVRRRYDG